MSCTSRPIADDDTTLVLQVRHRRAGQVSEAARLLRDVLVEQARLSTSGTAWPPHASQEA